VRLTRQTAVDWGVAKAVKDTDPLAHIGYKLASRLLRTDQPLIESLARELTSQGTIAVEQSLKEKPTDAHSWPKHRREEHSQDVSRERSTYLRIKEDYLVTRDEVEALIKTKTRNNS
jgi:hypothetical protein